MRPESLECEDPKPVIRCLRVTCADDSEDEFDKTVPPEQQSVKGLLNAFVDRTTLHGIGRIFASRTRTRKLAWILVCLTLLLWAAAQCYQVVKEYNEHPIRITRNTEEDSRVDFPAVTLCNLNPLPDKERLTNHETWKPFLDVENANYYPECHINDRYGDTPNFVSPDIPDVSYPRPPPPCLPVIPLTPPPMRELQRFERSIGRGPSAPAGGSSDSDKDGGYAKSRRSRSISDWNGGEDPMEEDQPIKRDWLNTGGYVPPPQMNVQFGMAAPMPEEEVVCTEDHFKCEESSCIPLRWKCNGIQDCQWNSLDEENCTSCADGYFQCPNTSTCIEGHRICDGKDDCPGGLDETTDDCPPIAVGELSCPDGYFRCQSGLCLHDTFFCDGIPDCETEEDEKQCVIVDNETHKNRLLCSSDYTKILEQNDIESPSVTVNLETENCSIANYTEYYFWNNNCNISVHCDNFGCYDTNLKKFLEFKANSSQTCSYCSQTYNCSDDFGPPAFALPYPDTQMEVNCTEDHFRCEDGSCIPLRWRCNGISDCSWNSDENNCTSCTDGFFQCPNTSKCIEDFRVCDGRRNCPRALDETPDKCQPEYDAGDSCPDGYFRCQSGLCLHPTFFCDGISDCDAEEDENQCVTADAQTHINRLLCSEYYITLLELNDVAYTSVTKHCPVDNYTESASWSPMCSIEVFCDIFGCYDTKLKKYVEFQSAPDATRCSYCSMKFNCWKNDWIEKWSNNSLDFDGLSWMLAKKEPDFHDITTLYTPSKDILEKASVPTEQFIFSCNFAGKSCGVKDFFTWIDNKYGKCYTFNSINSGDVRQTDVAGPTHGLRLNINLKTGLALLSPEIGLRIMIHDPREIPFPDENGFNVGHNSVSVSISKTVVKHYGEEFGWCKKSEDEFPAYSQLLCNKLCIEKEFRRQCACSVDTGPAFVQLNASNLSGEELPSCSNLDILHRLCKANVQRMYKKKKIECHCPPNCREELYKPRVTTSTLNNMYFTVLNNYRQRVNSVCDRSNNLMVSLHVYLDSLRYELLQESPSFTWDSLIGTLGGTLGLVIGVSIVTLLEAVELLLDIWSLVWRQFLARKVKDQI